MKHLLWVLCCIWLLSACSSSKKILKENTELNEIVVSSSSNEYRAAEPKYWDIVHTDILLEPFQKKDDSFLKESEGEAVISLHPYYYATDSLVLDAKSMEVDFVTLQKPFVQKLKYTQEDDKLILKFDRKFQRTDTIQLFIHYTSMPYAVQAGGSKAISEDRGLYYINNNYEIPGKPKQIWTQGETQANSHWFPTLDQPNEKFTTTVSLLVPENLQTLSNGKLISWKEDKAGWKVDKWETNKPIQAYAVMFAVGQFHKVFDKEWKGKEVSYYVEPEYAPYAKLMFKNTPEMIDYFSKITGVDYPWEKYSQIVVRDYVSGAMENTSASLFGEFMNQNARENADKDYEDVVSHELFHQWFGDYVTAESWSNLTVNESFATYGEQLWRKHQYGKVSNDELAYNDLNLYLTQAENDDPSLVRYYYNNREDLFDRVSYQKGSMILRYLHGLTGDSAFYKAMNIYLTNNALKNAEASDWRKAVEDATGLDWNWFFNQWYYRGGHPELKIDYKYDDAKQQMQVIVKQTQADSSYTYKLPLKAKLVYDNEQEIIDWNIKKRKQTFYYPYKNGIRPLFIPDTEHWLVGTMNESKGTKEWLQQLRASDDDYITIRRSIAAAFYQQQDSISQTIFHEALKDHNKEIKTYALTLLQRMPDKHNWWSNFTDEVSMLSINDGNNLVRASAFDVLGNWNVNRMKDEMINAISDSSYAVAGAALSALSNLDSAEGYRQAKQLADKSGDALKAVLQDAVWLELAKAGTADDIHLLEREADKVYGKRKISLATSIYFYSLRTKNDAAFERGLKLITRMTNSESIRSYRFSVGSLIFALYNDYNDQSTGRNKQKAETAKRRAKIIEQYKQEILSAEKDSTNIAAYNRL